MTHAPRSTRDRPAKPPLSRDAVVDAALAILRTDGLDAVTMRRVAGALDTAAGSLYVYVDNRDALLQAMRDRVLATVRLEPPSARWRAQLHTLLADMRRALVDHPGIAASSLADAPTSEAALLVLENLFGILLAAGLEPRDAAWTADTLAALVTHAAIEEDVRRTAVEQVAADVSSRFAELPADRFPLVTEHAAALVSGTAEQRFRFGVDAVVDGVLARQHGGKPSTGRAGSGRPRPTER